MTLKTFFAFPLIVGCLLVTACGPDFEAVRVGDIVPYAHERTAGTGVAYVRAKLLPEKEVILEPQSPSLRDTRNILDGITEDRSDKVFRDQQNQKK